MPAVFAEADRGWESVVLPADGVVPVECGRCTAVSWIALASSAETETLLGAVAGAVEAAVDAAEFFAEVWLVPPALVLPGDG